MKRSLSLSRVLAGLLALAGVALVLRFAIASLPQSPGAVSGSPALQNPESQETLPVYPPPWVDSSGKVYTEPAYPPPPEGDIVLPPAPTYTPAPEITTIIEWNPSATFFPTPTPRPIPTRPPGPTETPLPLREPVKSIAGWIWYGTLGGAEQHWRARINGNGMVEGDPISLPQQTGLELSSWGNIYEVYPSPSGRYLVLGKVTDPYIEPIVIDLETGQIRETMQEYLRGWFL